MAKIYVGMSGGVDSSLSAALLVEAGHDVTGVYMKNWSQDLPGMKCPWAEDLADAKRVAVQLGIDFKVFDFEKQYKQKVVDYMVEEYVRGRTPNPDIMCNQEVKFRLFLEAAIEDGAEMIATGHYARVDGGVLKRAKDENKDQTYFLYRVNGSALKRTLFPLGDYTKSEVREMARQRGLTTAGKKESMGVCFVGQVSMKDFLSQYVWTTPGEIVDSQTNKVVGRHDGAIFYTIGQRQGLNIGGGLPYYVAGKDMQKNQVYVTRDLNDQRLWLKTINLSDIHWINSVAEPGDYQVRIRHRAALADCYFDGEKLLLRQSQRAITPGQSAVIYSDGNCLGGGVVV